MPRNSTVFKTCSISAVSLLLTAVSAPVYATSAPGALTMDAGRGLVAMQTARTYGRGVISFGIAGFGMAHDVDSVDEAGQWKKITDYTSVVALPFVFGLTDEIDLSAAVYGYHDARPYIDPTDITAGYDAPASALGAARVGFKIRVPFPETSRVQIAGSFGAVFDTSTEQVDGFLYPWTRTGTDITAALSESFDLNDAVALHLSQGYVMSGTDAYDDQVTAGAGLSIAAGNRLTLTCEVTARTFLGASPWSVRAAGGDPSLYERPGGVPMVGDPLYLIDDDTDIMDDHLLVTPGLHLRLNEHTAVTLGLHYNLADHPDPADAWLVTGGLTFTGFVPSMRDSDGDGITDDKDVERDTPQGYPVDGRGRALDMDGDGVPDGGDREPETPRGAMVNAFGMGIDTDSDGVYDGIDRESRTQPGNPVDEHGVALDGDLDGVPDGHDREPGTPAGAVVDEEGVALDGDRDGVPDGIDRESDTPAGAAVDTQGVLFDDDLDGVANDIDEELDTPSGVLVDKRGRALIRREYTLLREGLIRLDTVNFPPGSSEAPAEAYPVLEEVGRLMRKYSSLHIQVEGHTDSSGDPALNMRLARERARAVLDHILARHPDLDRKRFRVVGYGADKPVAPNNTAMGRRANRRVDFVVINHDRPVR